MKVCALSEEIVKRIAAGEVIERPASVVKELLENSLDAGAHRIDLEIKGAGRLLIRISDDGCGMDEEDLRLCIGRHTTSKIKSVADLDAILSLGFRGEALYSVASVSKMDITSRVKESPIAHKLSEEGGKILNLAGIGAPVGTTIEVKDLFWNTPARLKFLKSPTTETNHIFDTVALYALTRPDVSFRLKEGDRQWMDLDVTQDLQTRIGSLFQGLCEEWIPVDYREDSLRVKGYVSHPKYSRADRSYQYFFVNQRPVKIYTLNYGLDSAFHSLIPEGRHAIAFLFLDVDPKAMDVNVHPSKREVRFHNTQGIQNALREAVRKALSSYPFKPITEIQSPSGEGTTDRVKDSLHSYFETQRTSGGFESRKFYRDMRGTDQGGSFAHKETQVSFKSEMGAEPALKILGCFDDLFWVIQLKDHLALMDQHAAHERVLYEKYLNAWRQKKVEVQPLLLPENMTLSKEDFALTTEYRKELNDLGFGIEDFGDSSVLLNQVPVYCQTGSLKPLVLDILDDLKTLGKSSVYAESKLEEKIILRACKSAVKAHDVMEPKELELLIEDLFRCELPFSCPHGRPTWIKLTKSDLEKMFKRR